MPCMISCIFEPEVPLHGYHGIFGLGADPIRNRQASVPKSTGETPFFFFHDARHDSNSVHLLGSVPQKIAATEHKTTGVRRLKHGYFIHTR